LPKIIRLGSISQTPVVIGTDGSKKKAISDEERLLKIKKEKQHLEKEIQNLKKEMAELSLNSKKDTEDIIKNAKEEAKKILEENSNKCNQQIEEANKKREQIFSEAKESGYKEGYEEGKQKASEDIKNQMSELINALQNTIDTINTERDKIFFSLKDDVARLIISYVRKIIKLELKTQKNIILANIESALKEISSKDSITIILSRDDIELVEEHSDEIKSKIRGLKNIKFLIEPYITKGGCIIETDYGSIDATIESQLFELEKLVSNTIPNSKPVLELN
jgi:flagellar assembly protein FliH